MSKTKVDVWCSVVTFQTPAAEIERLASTLSRVRASVSLTIVDNSSSLPPLALPEALQAEVIRPGTNLGYGRGHNLAIEQSMGRCRYHLVLNSDIIFEPDVIDELCAFMDERPTAGLVMPKVYFPDGSLQHLCRLLPNPVVLVGRRFFGRTKWAERLNATYELHDWAYNEVANFPFLSGCFMFIRRSILDQVEGFDSRYFLYAEDLDLSRRIHLVAETLFYPNVSIIHEYRSLKRRSWSQWRYAIVSLTKYFNKWGWLFDEERDRINKEALERLVRVGKMDSEAT